MSVRWTVLLALATCAAACAGVQPRYPDDVQAALAHSSMKKLETPRFIIYYPDGKRAEVDRFLARADRCAAELRRQAVIKTSEWAEKMVVVMPDVAFNNAFVEPELSGYETVSVIPLQATLDFTTEFGIPPDPGYIACHELTHYVHEQQLAGTWAVLRRLFGNLYTPQLGYDPWFFEGLATHYESVLSPGVGRPRWPIFTGMFAAGYANAHLGGGDLSSLNRMSSLGHHYLVGTMFFRFLTESYGERPLWLAIADEAHALTGWSVNGTFKTGFGKSLAALLGEFDAWAHRTFPARTPPASQKRIEELGEDARYARGRDGTEAWVTEDVDSPPRFIVRDARGRVLAERPLVELAPPRTLVQAAPILVSGLSITADGAEVWLTVIDVGATFQVPRTLRWRRDTGSLDEIATDLGPGATISPRGDVYYYCWVNGDSWSLAAFDTRTHARRFVHEMPPGTYIVGAQVSPDSARLAANVWDGRGFVAWVLDATTGAHLRTVGDPVGPIYDASFTSDGRLMWLASIAGRFQAIVEGTPVTDAPYAVLAAREAGGTVRFLDREGWHWSLAEAALPPPSDGPRASGLGPPEDARAIAPGPVPKIEADGSASAWDHLFWPQQHSVNAVVASSDTTLLGMTLGGGDRLGLQRWSLSGFGQLASRSYQQPHFGAEVAYLNEMLSPVAIYAAGSMFDWVDEVKQGNIERRTRDAVVAAVHTYRGTLTTAIAGVYSDDYTPLRRAHLAGPQAGFAWIASEETRYTGPRRAFVLGASASYYPHDASTFAGDITDLSAQLGGIVPLPFGRRHTLHALVRGRALVAPFETGLLQVGGDSGLGELWNGSSSSATPPVFDDSRFPPGLRFIETLRGYEDYAITTDRAALADLAWDYPIIIDRGVATTARVLPATFVSELDLELFGAGALDRAGHEHGAAGAAITLKIQLLRVSLAITYQLARRLADDRAITQLVGVGPGP